MDLRLIDLEITELRESLASKQHTMAAPKTNKERKQQLSKEIQHLQGEIAQLEWETQVGGKRKRDGGGGGAAPAAAAAAAAAAPALAVRGSFFFS
jgi:hypothetical protein